MSLDGTFRSYFGAVCVPILDKADGTISNVTHDWANAMGSLGAGLAVTTMRLQIRNKRVDLAKERLAELALKNNCQWAFFVDDDTIPPPDTLLKMVKLWKSDPKYKVISGVYWSKSNPPVPLIFNGQLEGSFWDWTTQDLIKADGAGAGCLFIDTDIFRQMPKPWFSCNYGFEDPRTIYDIDKWRITDQLGAEIIQGKGRNKKKIKELTEELADVGDKIKKAEAGEIDPKLYKNKKAAAATTEDLFLFKKIKEYTGYDLWVDCSIQCKHQDKRTGRMFGITPDMPQARPRYEGSMEPGDAIVLDIGCGDTQYWIPEGKRIRLDINPDVEPDVVADARALPFEDCFADMVYSSHLLEHFSIRDTINILKEWIRVLKIGGKFVLVLPNLKWASHKIMKGAASQEQAELAMNVFYSGQKGTVKEAHEDVHKAGFTVEIVKGLLERLGVLKDIEVHTSQANYGMWDDPRYLCKDDSGFNIIAIAKKVKHDAAISLLLPIKDQEEAKLHVGDKAKKVTMKEGKRPEKKKRGRPKKKKRGRPRKKK